MTTGTNADGIRHNQNVMSATVPYFAIEDKEAFHEIAERMREAMIAALKASGAPINVWRTGALDGDVHIGIDWRTGELGDYKDSHVLRLRVRASTESTKDNA